VETADAGRRGKALKFQTASLVRGYDNGSRVILDPRSFGEQDINFSGLLLSSISSVEVADTNGNEHVRWLF